MPLRILRLRGLVNASLVRGFLVTGMYSTFFLGTLYLEQVRHFSALQTGAAFLPWTLTVARPLAGHHGAARRALRRVPRADERAWRAPSPGCCCSRRSARTPRSSRRSSSPASRSGSGIGNAFMPLLTLAMADVPPPDAGLGSGITNVSQQLSGALGLAVLSTIAANHTKGLLADGHGATELADRRLPARLPRRGGGDRRGHRPRVRAAAAARTAAGARRVPSGTRSARSRPASRSRSVRHERLSLEHPHEARVDRGVRRRRTDRRREARLQVAADGVIASYIRDIAGDAAPQSSSAVVLAERPADLFDREARGEAGEQLHARGLRREEARRDDVRQRAGPSRSRA